MGNQIPAGIPPIQEITDPLKVVTKLVTTSPKVCLKKQQKIAIKILNKFALLNVFNFQCFN